MGFNSRFHPISATRRVFGGEISYVEHYVETLGPKKGTNILHVALKNDADISLKSPTPHPQLEYFRTSGLIEILPNLLVNPEAVAQTAVTNDGIRLILAGKEGQLNIKRANKVTRRSLGIYTAPQTQVDAAIEAIENMDGDIPANIATLQAEVTALTGVFANLQTALAATNAGLSTGTLLVNRIEVG